MTIWNQNLKYLVLILVLVEDGLGVARFEAKGLEIFHVLILVLVEDGLGEMQGVP